MKTLSLLVPLFPSFLVNGMSFLPEDAGVSVEESFVGHEKENGLEGSMDSYFEEPKVEQGAEEAMQEAIAAYGREPRSPLPIKAVLGIAILASILAFTFSRIYGAQVTQETIKQFEEEQKKFQKERQKNLKFYDYFFIENRLKEPEFNRLKEPEFDRLEREFIRLKFLLDKFKFDNLFQIKNKNKFLFERKKQEELGKQLKFKFKLEQFEEDFRHFYHKYYMDVQ